MISLKTGLCLHAVGTALTLAASGLSAQTAAILPFETDFESDEGYTLGPLASDGSTFGWQLGSGLDASIVAPGAASSQTLSFFGGDWLDLLTDSGNAPVSWIDFYLKPVFVDPLELSEVIETEQSAVTGFVKVNTQGEVYAIDGDGLGGGNWVPSGELRNLQGDSSADWIRLTYRLDYTTKKWDLFVDGEMVMVDLGFLDQSITSLGSFSARADGETATQLDYFYAGNENPLYIDTSNDGLPDAWLTAQGLSIYSNQRSGDADLDGLDNLLEYRIASDAGNPDSDGDGVNDGSEYFAGADPVNADAYRLSALPFTENFEAYAAGSLGSQGNWTVEGTNADIQTTDVWGGSSSLSLGGDATASNALNGSGQSVVWIDLYLKPTAASESPDLVGDAAVGYYFDEEGRPIVFDGSGGNGSGFWKLLDAAQSSDWRRVTVKMDYGAQAYDFYLDGERLGAGLGFVHAQPFISRISASGTTTVDDISVDSVEPAALDDDRDGSTNAEEIAAGTNPTAFDTDGDGLADSLEILWSLDPNVVDATLAQPVEVTSGVYVWTTSFAVSEGYTTGVLAGQNGWAASGQNEITALEEASISDDPATDGVLERMAGMGELRRVWISFRAKLIAGELPTFESSTDSFAGAFGASSASTLAVWDDASADWNALTTNADLAEWNDYALHFDYVDQVWTLCLNGVIVADGLPFRDENLVTFSRFKALQAKVDEAEADFEAATAYFDDFRFANTEPANMDFDGDGLLNDQERQIGSDLLLADTDGDGMEDLWEFENGLDLLVDDADVDSDGDGVINSAEYKYGLNPQADDADGALGFVRRDVWTGIEGGAVVDLTKTEGFPNAPDQRLWLDSLNLPTSVSRGNNYGQRIFGYIIAPETTDYTFWVTSADSSEFWLSSDSSSFNRERMCYLSGRVANMEWDRLLTQKSQSVSLQAGQAYYFEVLHKDDKKSDRVAVAWQYGNQSRKVISGEFLGTSIPEAGDQDQDGLPDDWESANGLDPQKGYGVDGYAGDLDGDGLLNHQERKVGTDPELADTDGDGYSDLFEVEELTSDPLFPNETQWSSVSTLAPSQFSVVSGEWELQTTIRGSGSGGGVLTAELNLTEDAIYQLEGVLTRIEDSPASALKPVEFLWYVDGEYYGRSSIAPDSSAQSSDLFKRLGHLKAGNHILSLRWLNVHRDAVISIESLSLLKPVAETPEALAASTEAEVAKFAYSTVVPQTSQVSPVCIEGRADVLSALQISPIAQPIRAGVGHWYADVALSEDEATAVSISFQNGGHVENHSIEWVATNVFEQDAITIRVGDSLKLGGTPVDSVGGSFDLALNGVSLSNGLSHDVAYLFDTAGEFTASVTYTASDGVVSSASTTITVVDVPVVPDSAVVWAGRSRNWEWPQLPSSLVVEAEGMGLNMLSQSQSVTKFTLGRDEIFEELSIVARLEDSGSIIASVPVQGFSLQASVEGYLRASKLDDATHLVENEIHVFSLSNDVEIKINVFRAGVVLDDGNRYRYLSSQDFDTLGRYTFHMVKPSSLGGGACHHIKVYEDGDFIGRR